ncbi:hypothetical protein FLONG3_2619 [Fusarium longipes]|uniref:Mfs general substrate transporter n=1 Tax=Fusarium longipes TaxID=694270 RepID=A0A395T377_9HYPO|nr:hypothetical protein FLONG3_2619 [Fusarium longipes]
MPSLSNTDSGQQWPAPFRRIRHWFAAGRDGTSRRQHEIYPLNFWFCILVLLLTRLGNDLLLYPRDDLILTAVCRHYYENDHGDHGNPGPEFCFDERITRHWLSITRLLMFLAPLASTVAQIPMGILVDKGKRRLAFTINIFSTVLYWGSIAVFGLVRVFPLWCFYLSPIFLLLGGGPWALGNLVFATVSSSVRPEQRTTAFSLLEGLSGIPSLVAPLLYNASMSPDLWVAYTIALVVYSLTLLPALHLRNDDTPQNEDTERGDEVISDEIQPLLGAGGNSAREPIRLSPREGTRFGQKLNIIAICCACFFGVCLARGSTFYTFVWIWSQFGHDAIFTSVLLYIQAVVLTILFLVVLPLTIRRLDKTWRVAKRDIVLSSAWVASCAVGTLIILLAPNLATAIIGFILVTLEYAAPVSIRSFLASHFEKSYSGRLFAGIGIVETIGGLLGQHLTTAGYYTQGVPFAISLVRND